VHITGQGSTAAGGCDSHAEQSKQAAGVLLQGAAGAVYTTRQMWGHVGVCRLTDPQHGPGAAWWGAVQQGPPEPPAACTAAVHVWQAG
jgi:hypothetical protein